MAVVLDSINFAEIDIMNLPVPEQFPSEKIVDVMKSVMVFVLLFIVLTTLGVIFFAAH